MCSPKPGEAKTEEAKTHIQALEMQGKGECKVVLDGIISFLEYSGSSLQVYTFSPMSADEFRDERTDWLLCNHYYVSINFELPRNYLLLRVPIYLQEKAFVKES